MITFAAVPPIVIVFAPAPPVPIPIDLALVPPPISIVPVVPVSKLRAPVVPDMMVRALAAADETTSVPVLVTVVVPWPVSVEALLARMNRVALFVSSARVFRSFVPNTAD